MRVLVVEDEPALGGLVAGELRAAGFAADVVGSLEEARAAVAAARFGLILLDRRLPDGDGLSFLAEARARQPEAPVLLVTALDEVDDRVEGLDAGADDYLVKPVHAAELQARIRAALRRPGAGLAPPVLLGRLAWDPNARTVAVGGAPVTLKRRELALVECLIRRKGRVVQREQIVDEIYGFDDDVLPSTIETHVSRLRARLFALGAGVAIHPVRGVGYLMDAA